MAEVSILDSTDQEKRICKKVIKINNLIEEVKVGTDLFGDEFPHIVICGDVLKYSKTRVMYFWRPNYYYTFFYGWQDDLERFIDAILLGLNHGKEN